MEQAILRELEAFLLELGTDFAFVARQKRITVDDEDYYLDLLFYHRRLRRLVAIDLKLGRFQAADKGQMELYLRWLEALEMQPGEEPPLGLILCAGKTEGHVRLLQLEDSGIRVGPIPDGTAAAGTPGAEAPRRHPPGPRTARPANARRSPVPPCQPRKIRLVPNPGRRDRMTTSLSESVRSSGSAATRNRWVLGPPALAPTASAFR